MSATKARSFFRASRCASARWSNGATSERNTPAACFGQCLTLMVAVLQKDTLATHEALTSDTVEPVDIGRVVRALQRGQHWCLLPSLGHRHHLMPAVPMIDP